MKKSAKFFLASLLTVFFAFGMTSCEFPWIDDDKDSELAGTHKGDLTISIQGNQVCTIPDKTITITETDNKNIKLSIDAFSINLSQILPGLTDIPIPAVSANATVSTKNGYFNFLGNLDEMTIPVQDQTYTVTGTIEGTTKGGFTVTVTIVLPPPLNLNITVKFVEA